MTGQTFRTARVFDGAGADGRPQVDRTLLDQAEAAHVLAYLETAPVVHDADGFGPDRVDGARGDLVPLTWQTDGDWVWPGSVAYYLRTYAMPPDPSLVDHIRGRGYETPTVDSATRQAALRAVSNGRRAADEEDRVSSSMTSTEAPPSRDAADDSSAFDRLRSAAVDLGVPAGAYRIGASADGAWCLSRTGAQWMVFLADRGERRHAARFDTSHQAIAYLVGQLYLNRPAAPVPAPAPGEAVAPEVAAGRVATTVDAPAADISLFEPGDSADSTDSGSGSGSGSDGDAGRPKPAPHQLPAPPGVASLAAGLAAARAARPQPRPSSADSPAQNGQSDESGQDRPRHPKPAAVAAVLGGLNPGRPGTPAGSEAPDAGTLLGTGGRSADSPEPGGARGRAVGDESGSGRDGTDESPGQAGPSTSPAARAIGASTADLAGRAATKDSGRTTAVSDSGATRSPVDVGSRSSGDPTARGTGEPGDSVTSEAARGLGTADSTAGQPGRDTGQPGRSGGETGRGVGSGAGQPARSLGDLTTDQATRGPGTSDPGTSQPGRSLGTGDSAAGQPGRDSGAGQPGRSGGDTSTGCGIGTGAGQPGRLGAGGPSGGRIGGVPASGVRAPAPGEDSTDEPTGTGAAAHLGTGAPARPGGQGPGTRPSGPGSTGPGAPRPRPGGGTSETPPGALRGTRPGTGAPARPGNQSTAGQTPPARPNGPVITGRTPSGGTDGSSTGEQSIAGALGGQQPSLGGQPSSLGGQPSSLGGQPPSTGGTPPQWKVQPLPGEPPLTLYRDKRMVTLPAGTEIDRYGEPDGNVTYAARTQYQHRSLPTDWSDQPYHVYRLKRPVEALTGLAVPWFEQPGGGTVFVLPASVNELISDGALVEVSPSN